jgi:hypothetical protein
MGDALSASTLGRLDDILALARKRGLDPDRAIATLTSTIFRQ